MYPLVLFVTRQHCIPVAKVLRVQYDALVRLRSRPRLDLNLNKGVDPDVKDVAVFRKPGIRPPAVVTDANWGDTVDDAGVWHGRSLSARY
jgi:hypothetical protein